MHRLASSLAATLRAGGLDVRHDSCFDTVTVDGVDADAVLAAAVERGIDLRRVSDDAVAVSFDETSTVDVLADVVAAFGVDRAADSSTTTEHSPATWCGRASS